MNDRPDMDDAAIRAAFNHRSGELIFTDDTLDDYREARRTWASPGEVVVDTPDRLELRGARLSPGRPMQSVTIVDFGTIRGCLLA